MEDFSELSFIPIAHCPDRISGPLARGIPLKYTVVSPDEQQQRYPSGQRGWDEVPVRSASQVRILPSAPKIQPRRVL